MLKRESEQETKIRKKRESKWGSLLHSSPYPPVLSTTLLSQKGQHIKSEKITHCSILFLLHCSFFVIPYINSPLIPHCKMSDLGSSMEHVEKKNYKHVRLLLCTLSAWCPRDRMRGYKKQGFLYRAARVPQTTCWGTKESRMNEHQCLWWVTDVSGWLIWPGCVPQTQERTNQGNGALLSPSGDYKDRRKCRCGEMFFLCVWETR